MPILSAMSCRSCSLPGHKTERSKKCPNYHKNKAIQQVAFPQRSEEAGQGPAPATHVDVEQASAAASVASGVSSAPASPSNNAGVNVSAGSEGVLVGSPPGSGGKARKEVFKFSAADDVLLMREGLRFILHLTCMFIANNGVFAVTAQNPAGAEHGKTLKTWESVATRLRNACGFDVTGPSCAARVKLLLEYFEREAMAELRRSGTEVEFTERDKLLEEYHAMKVEAEVNVILNSLIAFHSA